MREALKPVEWVGDRLRHAIHVLHAFRKESRKTAKDDIDLARARFQEALRMAALKK